MDVVFFDFIYPKLIAAGLLGGLIHAIREDKTTNPKDIIRFMLIGSAAANFFTPYVLGIVMIFPWGLVAFGIGMSGKHLSIGAEILFNKILGKTENE